MKDNSISVAVEHYRPETVWTDKAYILIDFSASLCDLIASLSDTNIDSLF